MKPMEAVNLCEQMERLCIDHPNADGVSLPELQKQLQRLCAHFWHLVNNSLTETSLNQFWGRSTSNKNIAML
jgi:hypothetical protein